MSNKFEPIYSSEDIEIFQLDKNSIGVHDMHRDSFVKINKPDDLAALFKYLERMVNLDE